MTTPSKVNKALKKAGIDTEIVSGRGYYWFTNDAAPSIYSNNLKGYTTEEIVKHVTDNKIGPIVLNDNFIQITPTNEV